MAPYPLTLFLSAFLLFQVQPLIGKYILPWFGGSPAVWTTCMLFFQVLLLGGYSYAYWMARRLSSRKQALLHWILLGVTLFLLPITPSGAWKPSAEESRDPTWPILSLLFASIGAPYFVLSSTGPLVQGWFSRIASTSSPYWLYALSNAGSLLALVSYPFLIEPALTLTSQAQLWSWSFALFALACGYCGIRLWTSAPAQESAMEVEPPVKHEIQILTPVLWFSLAGCGALMLLATTNEICQDVAVVPFMWILPLGIYLLSFIVCFSSEAWYSRGWYSITLIVAVVQACFVLFRGVDVPILLQVASCCFTLAACCMVCHGELARLKPDPRHLTSFYLTIAAGGAAAGVFVNLVAPGIFKGFWEFHLGLVITCALLMIVFFRDSKGVLSHGQPWWAWTVLILAFVALLVTLDIQVRNTLQDKIEVTRNFYGLLRVVEDDRDNPNRHHYSLMHGRIEHGYQFRLGDKRYWPTSYYGPESGIGVAISLHPRRLTKWPGTRNLRIGVVGLGVGTIAAYGEAGDYIRFYELNSEVVRLSDKYFTYLKDSPARTEVTLGDARVSMERELARGESQQFDVLAIDAFSSDAIPVHLLTRECFEVYWRHLKEDGILAFHISSRYLDLRPVVRKLASLGQTDAMECLWIAGSANDSQGTEATDWLLVTRNREFIKSGAVQNVVKPWPQDAGTPLLWTDDYTNLLRVLSH